MSSQANKLPSAFQTLTTPVTCSISTQKQQNASNNTLCGYRSKFNINEQKQAYQQQQALTQQQPQKQKERPPQNEPAYELSWCDLCERSFKNSQQLSRHISEHEKCCFEGCNFEAHSGLLKKHIEMQHNSGLFSRIATVETEEDIEKWREERRKRYPTKANIEMRQLAQEQRLKRGERLDEQKNRFGKLSDRNRAKEFLPKPKNEREATKKRQRKPRNRRNNSSAVSGVKENVEGLQETEKVTEQTPKDLVESVPEKSCQPVNSLSALIGMYSTSSDEEEADSLAAAPTILKAEPAPPVEVRCEKSEDEDDGPPEEQPIEKSNANEEEVVVKKNDSQCMGNRKRPFGRPSGSSGEAKVAKRPTVLNMTRKIRNQNSLLEKLLQKDIRHERNVLLQCVRHVVENNFFGVGQK